MKKTIAITAGCALLAFGGAQAQLVVNGTNFANGVYTQNFDSFVGTEVTLPTGWTVESSNTLSFQGENHGSSTTGGIYSYGITSDSDRALGVLESGSFGDSRILVTLENGLSNLNVKGLIADYAVELWRDGARHNRFRFRQSPDNSNFSEDLAFDRAAQQNPSSPNDRDGNAPAFRNLRQNVAIAIEREDPGNPGNLIPGAVGSGETQVLRWQFGSLGGITGARDGLAIDDVRLTLTNVESTASGTAFTTTVYQPVNAATLYSVAELYADTSSPAPAQQDVNYSYASYGMSSNFGGSDTDALLLAGVAGADKQITMTMTLIPSVAADNDAQRVSDVFSLTGTGTDLIVMQLTVGSGITSTSFLGWLDDGSWVNAVDGNTGNNAIAAQQGYLGSFSDFQALYTFDLSTYVGAWGVDTGNQSVWAVINHNSEFAAVPEPSTWLLVGLGSLALIARRKLAKKA